jgi:hypothetical protein
MGIETAIIGSAVLGAYSANKSAKAQTNAANQANQTQVDQYNQTRADNQPALEARNASLQRMQELLGVGGSSTASGYGSLSGGIDAGDVQNEAGYQFGMDQGMGALNNQLAARGMRNSGAALKAASRYGTDYATTKYDNAFNRELESRKAQLNPLQSLAGYSQSGASTIATAGTNAANAVSNNQTTLGNALGASSIAQGNALTGGVNQLGGWYQNMNNTTQVGGFNGNALSGYTNQTPWAVGPQVPGG